MGLVPCGPGGRAGQGRDEAGQARIPFACSRPLHPPPPPATPAPPYIPEALTRAWDGPAGGRATTAARSAPPPAWPGARPLAARGEMDEDLIKKDGQRRWAAAAAPGRRKLGSHPPPHTHTENERWNINMWTKLNEDRTVGDASWGVPPPFPPFLSPVPTVPISASCPSSAIGAGPTERT